MSGATLPLPGPETLAHLRQAVTIARRRLAGLSGAATARDVGLPEWMAQTFQKLGLRYLSASPCVRRLMEGAPRHASAILNFLPRGIQLGNPLKIGASEVAAAVRATVLVWARNAGLDDGLDAESLYRKSRMAWFLEFRNMGKSRGCAFWLWIDECEAGLIAPVALDGLRSMSGSGFPVPTPATIDRLRRAGIVSRRKSAGENPAQLMPEFGLNRVSYKILRLLGNRYLRASAIVRRLMEGAPHHASFILNFIDRELDMGLDADGCPSRQFETADIAVKIRKSVMEWREGLCADTETRLSDSDLDEESLYLKYRVDWCMHFRCMGKFRMGLFFAWLDECEVGLSAPVALSELDRKMP